MSKKSEQEAVDSLVIYNEDQQFYANVLENAKVAIKQMEDSIKLQKDIIEMSEAKIKELA